MTRFLAGLLLAAALAPAAHVRSADARLKNAFRRPAQKGWIFVHLEGAPAEIGFQHGFLLAPEIADAHRVIKFVLTRGSKDWPFFRKAAEKVLWPHIEFEYRQEMEGMVEGLAAKGVNLDIWDIVATNAWLELDPYYVKWADQSASRPPANIAAPLSPPAATRETASRSWRITTGPIT